MKSVGTRPAELGVVCVRVLQIFWGRCMAKAKPMMRRQRGRGRERNESVRSELLC